MDLAPWCVQSVTFFSVEYFSYDHVMIKLPERVS